MDTPIRCRIPDILAKIGKSQAWLSDITGLSKQRISDYCTMRKMMSIPTARLVASKLNVRVESLYVWEDEQQE